MDMVGGPGSQREQPDDPQRRSGSTGSSASSEYRCFTWDKQKSKREVRFGSRSCGLFDDERGAARAYDRAARMHNGTAAVLDFPAAGGQEGKSRLLSFDDDDDGE